MIDLIRYCNPNVYMNYNTGIYQIVNQTNMKRYIGSAVNLKKRKNEHFRLLKKNKHYSINIQRSYNKYGKEFFKFETILYCDKENLIFYEQRAINAYDFKRELYNISPTAGNCSGRKLSEETKEKLRKANLGKKYSKETKIKMSKAVKGRKHTKNAIKNMSEAHKGKKYTEESRKKMSDSAKKRFKRDGNPFPKNNYYREKHPLFIHFTNKQIEEMKNMKIMGFNFKEIAKEFNCNYQTIYNRLKIFNNYIKKEQLKKLKTMRNSGLSYNKISTCFNLSKETIRTRLKNIQKASV